MLKYMISHPITGFQSRLPVASFRSISEDALIDMLRSCDLACRKSGWWFGTWLLFFHNILGIILPNLLSYFSRWLKSPTSIPEKKSDFQVMTTDMNGGSYPVTTVDNGMNMEYLVSIKNGGYSNSWMVNHGKCY